MTKIDLLQQLRMEIDRIDQQMIGLFLQRMNIVDEIGKLKKSNGLAVEDKAREEEKIASALDHVSTSQRQDLLNFLIALMKISKERQLRNAEGEKE